MSFKTIVDRFIDEASESSMEALVSYVRSNAISDDGIAYLASSCAEASGFVWKSLANSADVPSTGGPSSLTTLLCPLFLRAFGYRVPKLGVPGRPAGGIDVMAQIPGYKFSMTDSEAHKILDQAGYVHFLADQFHGRHDAQLFSFRKAHNALNLGPLVIASLLTKKLIVGISFVGLDVRVSPWGNFGHSWREARLNAKRFCAVASVLGISSVCFLTNASVPYQPYFGRGESLVALGAIFDGTPPVELKNHLDLCYAIARGTVGDFGPRPTEATLRVHFEENLRAQGTSIEAFSQKVKEIKRLHEYALKAVNDGFLDIDIEALRQTLVAAQKTLSVPADIFADPVGLIFRRSPGEYLLKGETVATVRSIRYSRQLESDLSAAFVTRRTPEQEGFFEEVRNV